jgi:uncharacterized protein (UPF0147 family)
MNDDIKRNIGRPIGAGSIRAMAARRAREAVNILAEIAQDTSTPAAVRLDAAGMLLAYVFNAENRHEKKS